MDYISGESMHIANEARSNMQRILSAADHTTQDSAEIVAKKLYNSIIEFQSTVPENDDIILLAVNFGAVMTIFVENIGYIGSNLVVFYGKDSSGKPLELIQHIHQLSFLLSVAPKPSPELPKRQIGFVADN